MLNIRNILAAVVLALPVLSAGCADNPSYGSPGYGNETWHQHVRRCLRHYPHYDPHTDLVYRRSGDFRCPL